MGLLSSLLKGAAVSLKREPAEEVSNRKVIAF